MYWFCLALMVFRALNLSDAFVAVRSFVLFRSEGAQDLGAWMLWIVVALGIVHWLNSRGTFATWWRRAPIRSSPSPMVAPPRLCSCLFRRTTRRLFIFSFDCLQPITPDGIRCFQARTGGSPGTVTAVFCSVCVAFGFCVCRDELCFYALLPFPEIEGVSAELRFFTRAQGRVRHVFFLGRAAFIMQVSPEIFDRHHARERACRRGPSISASTGCSRRKASMSWSSS